MNILLKTIRDLLWKAIQDIDSGNSNLDESGCDEVIQLLTKYTRQDQPLSKYQAYTHLNMSRAKFDNLVAEGKLPHGKKVAGFKELMWYKKDLNKYINKT